MTPPEQETLAMSQIADYSPQGHVARDLAARFGTPLYVYDADTLRSTYTALREGLHPGVDVFYSAKANPNISVCGLLRSMGAGMEVSSMAELVTALRAGTAPDDIIFLGPGKSRADLQACLDHGIYAVVCESLDELACLDEMASGRGTRVLLRVNPSFSAKGSRLAMGGKPRQFGIDQEIVRQGRSALRSLRHVRIAGFHAYLGTRILEAEAVVENTQGVLTMAEELAAELGVEMEGVDVGGGLGVAYFDNEKDLDLSVALAGVNAAVADFKTRHPGARVLMEVGRYLAAWCGTYVVQALYVKQSFDEWFVVADGGTNHHMAAVGIGSFVKRNFPVRSLTKPDEPAFERYTVTGPLCTPNDVVARNVALPEVVPGDLLGVARSGAYGSTASPGLFLSHGFPAEVLLMGRTPHLIRRRDTIDDLLGKQELIPM
jgi:diaminopimelate decarboxylase